MKRRLFLEQRRDSKRTVAMCSVKIHRLSEPVLRHYLDKNKLPETKRPVSPPKIERQTDHTYASPIPKRKNEDLDQAVSIYILHSLIF